MKRLILVLAVGAIIIAGFTSLFGQWVSDEAKRHFNRGVAAVEMAKSAADYEAAIKEFKQAIDLAPDWADAYYNLGKVQEQAEKFADAIASLRQYLRLAPNANDAETVKSLIDKLEYKAENTLTKADIISVLTSFSKWEAKAGCGIGGWLTDIKGVDGDSIKVPFTYLFPRIFPTSWKTLQVNGPTIKFDVMHNLCAMSAGDPKSHDCTQGWSVEVEVVSRTRVIERVVLTRETGWGPGDKLGSKYECEWSPPK